MKLTTWILNGFWPFKTQRNARKLLAKAKFESYYLFQARGTNFEPENMEFLHGQWVRREFRTHYVDFWIELFPSIYEFEIDFELTQNLNSAICDWVWTPRHIETSSKGLYPIQNTLYSIRTCNFWTSFRLFMIFFV